jgi:hypothetical protein
MLKSLPEQGFVFWPVGTGDSTTIAVDAETMIQLDLHHLGASDEDDDAHTPIVDRLIDILPKAGKTPYLALFVLTHPDKDHILGFKELLKRVHIGELWFSPRIFWEYKKDLCDDAVAFRDEALRRVKKTIEKDGKVSSGDRVRIIGYSEILEEEDFEGFPEDGLTIPGNAVSIIDGTDRSDVFSTFIHAPFKDDADGERNETSIAMQVTLTNDTTDGKVLLFGDLSYPILRKIFDRSDAATVAWDMLLAPHHCSKSVMYWKEPEDKKEQLKQDILKDLENAAGTIGYIIASCEPIPVSNKDGDDPPHAIAAARYKEIAPNAFLCTQEHPNTKTPEPIVFVLGENGFQYQKPTASAKVATKSLADAVAAARGGIPPTQRVGFGQ